MKIPVLLTEAREWVLFSARIIVIHLESFLVWFFIYIWLHSVLSTGEIPQQSIYIECVATVFFCLLTFSSRVQSHQDDAKVTECSNATKAIKFDVLQAKIGMCVWSFT